MKKINKKQIIFIIIAIIIFIIILIKHNNDTEIVDIVSTNEEVEDNKTEDNENKTKDKENKEENNIVIYVSGEVKIPGVYEIKENSRVSDAIEKAEGLTENADINNINLAYKLEDGMKVYIPNKNEKDKEKNIDQTTTYVSKEDDIITQNNNTYTNKTQKVNINTASQTELETLPGIGTSTALKICNYREENGKFKSIEDIKNVSGIGDSKYEKIKDLITL